MHAVYDDGQEGVLPLAGLGDGCSDVGDRGEEDRLHRIHTSDMLFIAQQIFLRNNLSTIKQVKEFWRRRKGARRHLAGRDAEVVVPPLGPGLHLYPGPCGVVEHHQHLQHHPQAYPHLQLVEETTQETGKPGDQVGLWGANIRK